MRETHQEGSVLQGLCMWDVQHLQLLGRCQHTQLLSCNAGQPAADGQLLQARECLQHGFQLSLPLRNQCLCWSGCFCGECS